MSTHKLQNNRLFEAIKKLGDKLDIVTDKLDIVTDKLDIIIMRSEKEEEALIEGFFTETVGADNVSDVYSVISNTENKKYIREMLGEVCMVCGEITKNIAHTSQDRILSSDKCQLVSLWY